MKPSLILPLVTALIGFGLGWLVKPATDSALPMPPAATTPPGNTTGKPSPAPIAQRATPAPPALTAPVRDAAAVPPAAGPAEVREKTADGKNAAKMLRLAEVLGLSAAQQADLKKLIAENQQAAIAGHPAPGAAAAAILTRFAASGTALEKSLAALLTPEQTAAFEDLRNRERNNRIETTAQRELGDLTEVTDLSPEQRDTILVRLRQSTTDEIGSIPPSLALILDSSILPLGPVAPSTQSIQTLRQLAEAPASEDPLAQHAKLIDDQNRRLEARLNRLKDILTPAQLAQFRATIADQIAIHDMMMPPPR